MSEKLGTLTLMSSGEMSARLSAAHRAVMARLSEPLRAIFLDTPAGFQENASELGRKSGGLLQAESSTGIGGGFVQGTAFRHA